MSGYTVTGSGRGTSDKGHARSAPRVWVLQGHRAGDNLQVQALADGLGWSWEAKNLTWQKNRLKQLPRWTPFYGRSASLRPLTPQARDGFQPPWPDLVLSVGWRSVPIARWIKGKYGAKLVHIGRPRAPLSSFDLVLTTPQYRLPDTENVMQLTGPLTTLPQGPLPPSAQALQARLADLPRPWIAVLVGGDTPSLKFPTSAAIALAETANARAAACKGSLLVLTSPRTSEHVTKALRDAIPEPVFFHQWAKDTDNPYSDVLAMADQFIVTNDSISMTHEAALTGQPLQVFPLKPKESFINQALTAFDEKMRRADTRAAKTYLELIRNGVLYPPKSPNSYFAQLMQNGQTSLASGHETPLAPAPIQPENQRAVRAVQALFDRNAKQALDRG